MDKYKPQLAIIVLAVMLSPIVSGGRLDHISGSFSGSSQLDYTPVQLLLFAFSAVFFSLGTWACIKRKQQGTPISGLVGIVIIAVSYLVSALSLYGLMQ